MARFMADVQGTRGSASRLGGAASGIRSHTRGWDVGVLVVGSDEDGSDVFTIYATSGSSGAHLTKLVGHVSLDSDGRVSFSPAEFRVGVEA